MAAKFYKKFSPETDVVLENNARITFTTLNHLVGYFSTEHEYVQQQFEKFMRQNRYAITEIPWEEFEKDYVLKKKAGINLKPLSREELSGTKRLVSNPIETLGAEAVAAVVGVKTAKEEPITITDASSAPATPTRISTPAPEGAFKPNVGRRRAARQS